MINNELMRVIKYLLVLLLLPANVIAAPATEKTINYQEVFFHFYRKDELNALINLAAADSVKKLPGNRTSNQLLFGSLYAMYGLHEMSEVKLKKVILNSSNFKQQALAQFNLSKVYFSEGELNKFSTISTSISDALPENLADELNYMNAMRFIQIGDLEKATDLLDLIDAKSTWHQYLAFNLGATFIKANKGKQGEKLLQSVGKSKIDLNEMWALADKANIVLGYYYLRNNDANEAVDVLEMVRLEGPFSNKALLGLGWAYSQKNQFRNALVPWLSLAKKDAQNVTVQEAMLASAFAFRKLGSEQKALALYKKSILSYESVKQIFDKLLEESRTMNVYRFLLEPDSYDDYALTKQIIKNKETNWGKLLSNLLKTDDFQDLLNDYRDLKQMQSKLERWQRDIEHMRVTSNDLDRRLAQQKTTRKTNNKHYSETVLTLGDTVVLQNSRLDILLGMHEEKIHMELESAINRSRLYIIAYLSQTRFAMAELLDKAQRGR